MDREQLYNEWRANNDRPVYVREHRETIMEHIDVSDPIPEGSAHEVREWLKRYKSAVTKQLKPETVGGEA